MDIQGAVLQLLVAAAPAVILYFTGWSYLYFYLNSFQINISEVNLDLPTVFIFAYPPLHRVWESYHLSIAVFIVIILLLLLVGKPLWQQTALLPKWLQTCVGVPVVRHLARRVRTISPTAWTICLLFVLVFLLPFPLARLTDWAATHAADQIWDGQTVDLVPVLKGEGVGSTAVVQESTARALTVPGSDSSVDHERTGLIANYLACLQAGELGLIFSSEAHYYLLCRSNLDRDTGNIFEVTGKEGLISVRESVYRQAGGEGR